MATPENIFKALGDTTRIRIVQMLAQNGEMCVCKIMEELSMTQPAVSHHLACLKHAGIVRARRQGQWIHYSLCPSTLGDIALRFLEDCLAKIDTKSKTSAMCCTGTEKNHDER
ncbi:MAG: metalloregulator ArsR/SmtB family transcription factor [Armatimonadetes bacterium]|nr:metalloregulator ArsR/SmtB family transcription factor [Armatimonadota bacterium]